MSSKLVRMEDAEKLLRALRYGEVNLFQAIDRLRALPAGGAETPGAIEALIARLVVDGRWCVGEGALLINAATAELSSLQAKAAERDSVVGKAEAEAKLLADLMQILPFTEWGRSDSGNVYRARYRALSATADSTEEEKHEA